MRESELSKSPKSVKPIQAEANEGADIESQASHVETSADDHLLDAYSKAVVHVAEVVSPSVVKLEGRRMAGHSRSGTVGGSGSGIIVSADGLVVTPLLPGTG